MDVRSIEDVHPDDLRSYTQCHFFAGIGVWSYALRRAGWPDDRPVWTGSCPCQPFSAAGKGTAFDDERHLWPAWHWLIQECSPSAIFGEQVASKDAEPWLDLVSSDLEALGFATAAVAFPSASVGAPHKRDRTYFVAHAQQHDRGRQTPSADHIRPQANRSADRPGGCGGSPGELGHAHGQRARRDGGSVRGQVNRQDGQFSTNDADAPGGAGGMADTNGRDAGAEREQRSGKHGQQPTDGRTGDLADATCSRWREECADAGRRHVGDLAQRLAAGLGAGGCDLRPGPVNGFWRAADWLLCRDGKWRPVEPGTSPLAHGAPARVGRLRAYGNAINAQQAQIFIEESMRCI
ncbi:DNA cytosine methyltransferase [Achromobacter xylosoxidans]